MDDRAGSNAHRLCRQAERRSADIAGALLDTLVLGDSRIVTSLQDPANPDATIDTQAKVRTNGLTSKSNVLMGLHCAIAALVIAVLYGLATGNLGVADLLLPAPASAFATGTLIWWLMQPNAGPMSKVRGAIAGGLTGAIAHLPFWMFVTLVSAVCPEPDGCRWLDVDLIELMQKLPAALFLSLASLIVVGWLTVPVGAAIGTRLAAAVVSRPSPDEAPNSYPCIAGPPRAEGCARHTYDRETIQLGDQALISNTCVR